VFYENKVYAPVLFEDWHQSDSKAKSYDAPKKITAFLFAKFYSLVSF
jgi:hypothetical protein